MPNNNSDHFDPNVFIDELIEEMGMQNEDRDKLAKLKKAMLDSLILQLLQAAQDSIEPEVIDMVLEELQDETDSLLITQKLAQASPSVQLALLEALDTFREDTLEAFNILKV